MNKIQNNKLTMFGSVEELLMATTETGGIAGLPAKLTALTAKLTELQTLAGTQTQPTEGQTASRDQVLETLVDTALQVAGIVGAYAHEKALPDLAALVDVQRSDFDSVRLVQRPLLAQRVHDAAAGALKVLAHPGVTADTLAAFQTQIDAARVKLKQPRMIVVAKRAATTQLATAFRDIEALLTKQIDRLLLPLAKTSPGFYAQYRAARQIVNVPGGRSTPDPVTPAPSAATEMAPVSPTISPIAEPKAA